MSLIEILAIAVLVICFIIISMTHYECIEERKGVYIFIKHKWLSTYHLTKGKDDNLYWDKSATDWCASKFLEKEIEDVKKRIKEKNIQTFPQSKKI